MRQMQRLRDYAAARGYPVVAEVIEIASALNDERPKLKKVLTDPRVGVIPGWASSWWSIGTDARALATATLPPC